MATKGPRRRLQKKPSTRTRSKAVRKKPSALAGRSLSKGLRSGSIRESRKSDSVTKYGKLEPVNRLIRQASIKEPFHVSDLLYKCPRYLALALRHHLNGIEEPVWPSRGMTFAQGYAIEDFVVRMYCKHSPGKVWGNFTCACRHTRAEETTYDKAKLVQCEKCRDFCDKYLGFTIYDEKWHVVANIDLLFLVNKHLLVVDIKSTEKEYFEQAKDGKVSMDYEIQVIFYWHMMRRANYNLYDRAVVLYGCKNMIIGNPIHEHVVPIEEGSSKARLKTHLSNKSKVQKYVEGDDAELPGRSCVRADEYKAKNCSACVICFNLD